MPLNHIGTQVIETPRLLLRRFTMQDVEPMFYTWANDAQVTRFMRWTPHKNTTETRIILAKWIKEYRTLPSYHWAITLKPELQLIGSIGVYGINDQDMAGETGYCIARPYWGKGYAAEALRAVIEFMFSRVGLNRIEAYHSVNNPASGAVMRKCGMQPEGCCRQKYMACEGLQDCDLYAILAKDI